MQVQQASRRGPRRGWGRLPMWLQFTVSFGVGAVIVVAVVLWVHHAGNDTSKSSITSPKAVREENREANILVRQDQVPHTASVPAGDSAAQGLVAAVKKYMNRQIAIGVIDGPLTKAACTPHGGAQAFRCQATAAKVTYPFYGVVKPSSGQITYCKKDQAPVPGMNVPLAAKCL